MATAAAAAAACRGAFPDASLPCSLCGLAAEEHILKVLPLPEPVTWAPDLNLGKPTLEEPPKPAQLVPAPKQRRICAQACKYLSYVIYLFFVAYLGLLLYNGVGLLYPSLQMTTADAEGKPLMAAVPTWLPGTRFNVTAVVYLKADHAQWTAWQAQNIVFDSNLRASTVFANLSSAPDWLPKALENNKVPFVSFALISGETGMTVEVPMVVYRRQLRRLSKPTRKLVEGWPILGDLFPTVPKEPAGEPASRSNTSLGMWQPRITVHVVYDFTKWVLGEMPPLVGRALKLSSTNGEYSYAPLTSGAQMGLQQSDMIQVNTTKSERLPLELCVEAMTLPSWMFHAFFEDGLNAHRRAGVLQEEDLDEVKRMVTDTSPVVLGVTMLVSVVHIMFDLLAFKAEIGYWSRLDSAKGVSTRSLLLGAISQAIIFAYLSEQDATRLVLFPTGLGVLVSIWKVMRSISLPGQAPEQSQSDAYALHIMGVVLTPVVLGYAFLTLVRDEYSSWYSFLVSALAMSVYAGGFALMTPQVFLNYKLKSVNHLAWDALMYRAFNTFIDDWFAFIMPLPNMHRIMTLRDDVVFLVFLYQRWIYPVRGVDKVKEE